MKHYIKNILIKSFDYRYVYMMRSAAIGKSKIGIAKCVERRRSDIDVKVKGKVKVYFAMKFLFAEKVEKHLHSTFSIFHSPLKEKSSGFSEWFYLILPVRIFAVFYATFLYFFLWLTWGFIFVFGSWSVIYTIYNL